MIRIELVSIVGIALLGICHSEAVVAKSDNDARKKISNGKLNLKEHVAASRDFSIVLAGQDDETSSNTNVVYRHGALGDMWHVMNQSHLDRDSSEKRLFHHGPYSDRISFEVSYSAGVDTDFADPEVYAVNSKIAHPKVTAFSIDKNERHASVTIVYDCHHQAKSTELHSTLVFVTVPVISGFEVQFSFRKTCGGGRVNPHLDFGILTDSAMDGSQKGKRSLPQANAQIKPSFVAGPHHLSTRLFLQLHTGTQEFFHVQAKSTNSDEVDVALRGPIFGGVLAAGKQVVLHAVYTCEHHGVANISVTIPVPPFAPLVAHWTKDCGGGFAAGLSGATRGFDQKRPSDVVAQGQTLQRWHDGSTKINSSTSDLSFYFRNGGPPLHVGQIAITVDRPNIVYGYVVDKRSHPLRLQSTYMGGNGGFFGTGGKQQLHIELICKRLGSSRVTLTVPLKSYENVEISFRKQCKTPKQRMHSSFLRTANSLLNIFIVCVSMSGYLVFWVFRRSGGGFGKKQGASLSPQAPLQGTFYSASVRPPAGHE